MEVKGEIHYRCPTCNRREHYTIKLTQGFDYMECEYCGDRFDMAWKLICEVTTSNNRPYPVVH
jgi:DNA-directed RNA polymerase subunit RPC12/RpoP